MNGETDARETLKLKTEDFNAGSPYSSWLKEELGGEVANYQNGFGSPIIEKYDIKVDDATYDLIMHTSKLDDFPENLRKMAVETIRAKLDPDFEK